MADEEPGNTGAKRSKGFMSKYSLADFANERKPELYTLASSIVLLVTTAAVRTFLFCLGDCKIKEDENYDNFLKKVTDREKGTPLLTVSNHRSLFDDPAIMSGILPLQLAVQPRYNRNAICSQEYCCVSKLPTPMHVYTGLGRVLPIKRGAGINQKLLLDFARLVAAGEWCHVFPEGGIWQWDTLGGRRNGHEKELGKLKWGIGKLIAHAPVTPEVVPFYFKGTETIYPQDENKVVKNKLPIPGHKVNIRFGEEIRFDDFIAEHEKIYGALWKYKASLKQESTYGTEKESEFHEYWDSRPEDLLLYAKITSRIEEALTKLNDAHLLEHGPSKP
uniref:Tafazzin family protein n=1 Tax=Spumella elongata TaxID=89044 RepID=A0A7S3HNV6_9STRA